MQLYVGNVTAVKDAITRLRRHSGSKARSGKLELSAAEAEEAMAIIEPQIGVKPEEDSDSPGPRKKVQHTRDILSEVGKKKGEEVPAAASAEVHLTDPLSDEGEEKASDAEVIDDDVINQMKKEIGRFFSE